MALSRLAAEFAAEIRNHDWSDAPYRVDRAGHNRQTDTNRGAEVLSDHQTNRVRANAMWVTAQVLGHADPNFDPIEFAAACGVSLSAGGIHAGLRTRDGRYARPGTWDFNASPGRVDVAGS
jgi:hypothetical protein